MGEDQSNNLDVPTGMSNPWVFVQKRIIFENKVAMVEAMNNYQMIYAREKENDALLQNVVGTMRQLYVEIKEIIKKNKKSSVKCKNTIDYMEIMIKDQKKSFSSTDFPDLYKHYIGLLDSLLYIGLTNIESNSENPHESIISTDS